MLEQLRNAAKTWVAGIFIGLLCLSFAVWGINDIFTGTVNTDVARVGEAKISQDAFDHEFRRRIDQISAQTGQPLDTIQARQFGLDQQVLNELVQQTVLAQATENLGLTVSDTTLADSIRSDEAFENVLGEFSAQNYNELLRLNNLTPALYEERLRRDLTRHQLVVSLISGLEGSTSIAKALHFFREEKREVEYLVISPENAKDLAAPTEEEIVEFHEQNSDQYRAPEFRTFTYVLIEPDQFFDRIDVSEEELRGVYDFAGNRFVTPEKRTVRIMTFASEEAARAAHESLKQGETFASVAEANGFDVNQITQNNALQSDLLDAAVAETVFGLETGSVSEPINGDISWAIAEVTSITPKAEQPFEDVRAVILDEEKRKRATDFVYESFGDFQDAIAAGGSIEQAAEQIGLKAQKAGPIDDTGRTLEGETVSAVADLRVLLREAFEADVGLESDLLEISEDGYAMVRVDDVIESRIKPLEEVRSEVKDAFVSQKRRERLAELAADVAERGNSGTDFSELAGEFNRSVLKADQPLQRDFADELFSSPLVAELFTKNTGEFVYGPANFGESFVVAVTRKIIQPTEERESVDVYTQMLQQGAQSDILEQYLAHLNETLDVRIYQNVVDQFLGVTPDS